MSSQATTAIPIRAAGPSDRLTKSGRDLLSATPGGMNFYGSTPGGSRIVYSRDQLLSLASSPLSQSPLKSLASIPAEISRSPEKSAGFRPGGSSLSHLTGGTGAAAGLTPSDPDTAQRVFGAPREGVTSAGSKAVGTEGEGLSRLEGQGQQGGGQSRNEEEQFEMDL